MRKDHHFEGTAHFPGRRLDPVQRENGFTTVEIFVLIGLIGIVVALTFQGATGYRQRAQDALAAHDVGNAIQAEETHFSSNRAYVSVPETVGPAEVEVAGFSVSPYVQIEIQAGEKSFRVRALSRLGSGVVYEYDSDTGAIMQGHRIPEGEGSEPEGRDAG